jgi:membrane associated rhomboid family serine protease
VFCGRQCEPVLGTMRMLTLLVVGAYAAALAELAVNPNATHVIIGASGAISALLGFYALLFNNQQVKPIGPIPGAVVRVLWLAGAWTGIQLLIGLTSGGQIAFLSHIGGFLAGLALARPLLRSRFGSR